MKHSDIGVVVARFQTNNLTEGHHYLIKTVMKNHDKVVILLGVSPAKSTRNNPLDFKARELMVRQHYADLTVLPIYDTNNDHEWSNIVDKKIREVFAIGSVTLYGSRDGFIPHYHGEFKTVELEETKSISGSEVRSSLSNKTIASADFRAGLIKGAYDRYPISFTTVDGAVLNEHGEILLGHKRSDQKDTHRFIGGFVDINKDESLEQAVKREVLEETGSLGIGDNVEYIGSAKIYDWRYRGEQDGIMTSLFKIDYIFGNPKASDDMDELKWFKVLEVIAGNIPVIEEHKVLVELLKKYINKKNGF